jgi:hypothetical protein
MEQLFLVLADANPKDVVFGPCWYRNTAASLLRGLPFKFSAQDLNREDPSGLYAALASRKDFIEVSLFSKKLGFHLVKHFLSLIHESLELVLLFDAAVFLQSGLPFSHDIDLACGYLIHGVS